MQEKLIEHFSLCNHNGTHEDITIQIIVIQTVKKLEKTFGFSIWALCIHKV